MKKTILILAMIAACSIFNLQAQQEHMYCDAEKWSKQPGLILERKVFSIGAFLKKDSSKDSLHFIVAKFTDHKTGVVKSYLEIYLFLMIREKYKEPKLFSNSISLNIEDVDGVLEILKNIQSGEFVTENSSFEYHSNSGFSIYCYGSNWDGKLCLPENNIEVIMGKLSRNPKVIESLTIINFNKENFYQLISLFEQAKEKM